MRRSFLKRVAPLLLVCQACASGGKPSSSPADETPAPEMLSPADRVEIDVIHVPELSGEFEIRPDGTIEQPLYRGVVVTGISMDSVNALVNTVVARFQTHPQFVVKPHYRIAVTGQVRLPNIYALSPQTTVAEAVAVAGGPTTGGDVRHVVLTRRTAVVNVDLSRPDGEHSGMLIRSGDSISIPAAPRRNDKFLTILGFALGMAGAAAIIGSL